MDVRSYHRRLFEETRRLIPSGAKVVCAVSGGADSTAMLHGLCAVNGLRDRRWLLSVAHLDHRIRKDSFECAAFVQKTAGELGLECRVEFIDVPAMIKAEGGSLEEMARSVRYEFLQRTAEDLGASVVAVAHHADDQAETVLHRAIRGTGLHGLAGMRPIRPIAQGSDISVVRPFLQFRRSTLREYLLHRGLPFREDPTNADSSAATRNRIRHEVLPLLESTLNPKVVDALVRLAGQAEDAARAIKIVAAQALQEIRVEQKTGKIRLKATALATLPVAIRTEVVRLALEEVGVGLGAIGQERIEAAAELACRDRQLRVVELPGGVRVERRGEFWTVRTNKPVKRSRSRSSSQAESLHP